MVPIEESPYLGFVLPQKRQVNCITATAKFLYVVQQNLNRNIILQEEEKSVFSTVTHKTSYCHILSHLLHTPTSVTGRTQLSVLTVLAQGT